MSAPREPPPRLVEMAGPAGDCLRKVLAENPSTPEIPAFSALRERRQRRLQRQLAYGVVLSGLALMIGVRAGRHGEEQLSVRAEQSAAPARLEAAEREPRSEPNAVPTAPSTAPTAPSTVPTAPSTTRTAPSVALSKRAAPRQVPSELKAEPSRRTNGSDSSRPRVSSAPAPLAPSPPVEVGLAPHRSARACAELARSGAAEQALSCYEDLAKGGGITAELALFEQARLEGKALRRPEQALRTLDSYRRRFPNGSLRAEVMLAQIDWLLRVGERAQASQLVDEALASGSLQERRAELERLRDALAAP